MSGKPFEIRTLDGDVPTFFVVVPVAPNGSTTILGDDTTPATRELLLDLCRHWQETWPAVLETLQKAITEWAAALDEPVNPLSDEFMMFATRIDPKAYKGDQSDTLLTLDFDRSPLWDFFLKDGKIVHFQPVF